jgi:hypothetical protein
MGSIHSLTIRTLAMNVQQMLNVLKAIRLYQTRVIGGQILAQQVSLNVTIKKFAYLTMKLNVSLDMETTYVIHVWNMMENGIPKNSRMFAKNAQTTGKML